MAHFLNSCTSLTMRDRLEAIFANDSAYRVLHYILGPERVLEWAHSVGVATDEQLRACVSPLPPVELRSIVADNDPNIFLYTGWYDLNEICGFIKNTLARLLVGYPFSTSVAAAGE